MNKNDAQKIYEPDDFSDEKANMDRAGRANRLKLESCSKEFYLFKSNA